MLRLIKTASLLKLQHKTSVKYPWPTASKEMLKLTSLPEFLHFYLVSKLKRLIQFLFFFRDVTTKISEIINAMGDASAAAQGLTKPITTSDRLRNSDQLIYLLVDRNAKK